MAKTNTVIKMKDYHIWYDPNLHDEGIRVYVGKLSGKSFGEALNATRSLLSIKGIRLPKNFYDDSKIDRDLKNNPFKAGSDCENPKRLYSVTAVWHLNREVLVEVNNHYGQPIHLTDDCLNDNHTGLDALAMRLLWNRLGGLIHE